MFWRAALVLLGVGLVGSGCQTSFPREADTEIVSSGPEERVLSSSEASRHGRQQLGAGNNGMAEREFREAVERNPEDVESWIGLAAAYDNLGRFELADRAYDQASRLRGYALEIANNRGYSYLLRGDGRRALIEFRKALAIDPSNAVTLSNLELLRLGQRPTRTTPL